MKVVLFCVWLASALAYSQDSPDIMAEITTGNGFLRVCSDLGEKTPMASSYCMGYLSGLTDGMAVIKVASGYRAYCIPQKDGRYAPTNGQLLDILLKYIRENPQIRHQSTSALFFKAMREAYPCRGGGR